MPPHRPLPTAPPHTLRHLKNAIRLVRRRIARALGATGRVWGHVTSWRPRFGRSTRKSHRLVIDCEAFLAGRYPWRLPRRRRWEWAWINTLAHGDRSTLNALAAAAPHRGRRAQAASFVASEVLAVADRAGADLGWVQREYLVPIELQCMRGMLRTSASTTAAVLEALHRARRGLSGSPRRDS